MHLCFLILILILSKAIFDFGEGDGHRLFFLNDRCEIQGALLCDLELERDVL